MLPPVMDTCDWLATRESSGLIERDGPDRRETLQNDPALDEHTVARGGAESRDERDWHRDHERTRRSRHDEDDGAMQ